MKNSGGTDSSLLLVINKHEPVEEMERKGISIGLACLAKKCTDSWFPVDRSGVSN